MSPLKRMATALVLRKRGARESCAAAGIRTTEADAAHYPTKPIRLIVPFPPGGGTDIIARTLGQRLFEAWGQTVVVDNRAGANGIIGSDILAKAKPDGYTLLLAIATHAINPSLYSKLPYDTARDFAPITQLSEYPFILVVHPAVPAHSAKELIAVAKARPGQLSYASSGNGSGPHLGVELFKTMAQIDMVHVPYKGAGPANIDLLAGQVQVMFNNLLSSLPMIRAGKLRMLAVTSLKRSPAVPELPTISESALPGFAVTGWHSMFAPAGTPPAVIDKIQRGVAAVLQVREVNERLAGEGAQPVGSTPQQFTEFLQAETQKWAKVIRDARVPLE